MALAFDDDQAAALLDALGLPTDTTDVETIHATVRDAVTAIPIGDGAKPSEIAAAAKRNGLEVVDTDTIAALRRDAAEGRTIKAAAEQQRIEASVDAATGEGKITPARRQHWVTLLQADPGMADVLASVPDNTVPIEEIGHGVSGEDGVAQGSEWFH